MHARETNLKIKESMEVLQEGDDNTMKLNTRQIITIIILLGVLLRCVYILKTPITERQHDVYTIEDQGHLGYIYTIYETGKLPQTNGIQFYHPPLFHYIAAGWLKVETTLGLRWNSALEGIQILTLVFSSLIMIVVYKIIDKTDFKDKYKILVIAMMAFHPTLIILSGSINNDVLTALLMFLIILFLIKWDEETNIKNTIILAILTGLCVMSKVSGAIMAVPIIIVFINKIVQTIKTDKKKIGKLFVLFIVFGLISLPIGLWHSIRNYILFNQPLGGVLLPWEGLYVGNYSFYQRFLSISIKELITMFCTVPGDYNTIAYIIKCSLFGEFILERVEIIGCMLKVLNVYIIVFSLIAIILKYAKHWDSNNKTIDSIVFSTWIIHIISYVMLNIKYPYTCTMDFRYLVPTVFCGIYFIALALGKLSDKKIINNIRLNIEWFIIAFYILSTAMFCVM